MRTLAAFLFLISVARAADPLEAIAKYAATRPTAVAQRSATGPAERPELRQPAESIRAGIQWQTYQSAYDSGGLVLVVCSEAPRCGPCQEEERLFFDPDVVRAMQCFHCVYMNPTKGGYAAHRMTFDLLGVTRVPTAIIISPDGETVRARRVGAMSKSQLLEFLSLETSPQSPANPAPEGPQHSIVTGDWCDPVTGICYGPHAEPRGFLGRILKK